MQRGLPVLRRSLPWLRRGGAAALLLAVSFAPAQASVNPPQPCSGECTQPGTTRWVRPLAGSYVVQPDSRGTTPARGEAYAAIGPDVAAYGLGGTVQAFDARTGAPRWTADLNSPGAPPGTAGGGQIVSVRSWPGVVTAGLSPVSGSGPQRAGPGGRAAGSQETEVVLDAATGREIRAYPGAVFGGAVAADSRHTVVVRPGAVTSYRNATGAEVWSVPTGPEPETWRLDGDDLYLAVDGGSDLAQQPTSELRQIDLRTGAQRIVRAYPGTFEGSLGAALDGVVLFTSAGGATAYSGSTGHRLWSREQQDFPQGADLVAGHFYLSEQGGLAVVDPWTGKTAAWLPGSSGLYAERDGVALGMDAGPQGSAWGVDATTQRVAWTAGNLPWPHYFVDLGGIGGSADPRSDAVILASCAQANLAATAQPCLEPELVVINR